MALLPFICISLTFLSSKLFTEAEEMGASVESCAKAVVKLLQDKMINISKKSFRDNISFSLD